MSTGVTVLALSSGRSCGASPAPISRLDDDRRWRASIQAIAAQAEEVRPARPIRVVRRCCPSWGINAAIAASLARRHTNAYPRFALAAALQS
jgi:hypothetical protein